MWRIIVELLCYTIMKLPVLMPEVKSQCYDCHACTTCCRELVVHLTKADKDRIDRQEWGKRLGVEPYIRLGRGYVLNHAERGGCVFLLDDGRCRIHAEHGYEAKPLGCQLYPFTLESDCELMRVGLRFDCPSVSSNQGSELAKHRRDVERLAVALKAELPDEYTAATFPLTWVSGRSASQAEEDMLVEALDAWLADAKRSLWDRLLGMADFLTVLGRAKLDRLDESQCIELITMLSKDLPQAVDDAKQRSLEAITSRQLKLVRQSIFSYCESITIEQSRRSFIQRLRYRLGQLRRASRFTSGESIPPLLRDVGGTTFADVDAIKLADDAAADCDELLTRYLRACVVTRKVFGRSYYGWGILDGLRSLLLSCGCVGWLARYVAAVDNRSAFALQDVQRALGIVDRAAGRMPELGSRPALMRTRYLAEDRGIERLLLTYSIS